MVSSRDRNNRRCFVAQRDSIYISTPFMQTGHPAPAGEAADDN